MSHRDDILRDLVDASHRRCVEDRDVSGMRVKEELHRLWGMENVIVQTRKLGGRSLTLEETDFLIEKMRDAKGE